MYNPREAAKAKNMYNFGKEPFGIRCKEFRDLSKIQEVFDLMSKLPHENDGLILGPVHQPYKAGRDQRLLKWKPPHLNTVDFKLEVKRVSKPDMPTETVYNLLVQGGNPFFGTLRFDTSNKEQVKFFK